MSFEEFVILCFFLFAGIGPFILGILIWSGYFKGWFVIERIPVIVPTAFYNGSMVFMAVSLITFFTAALIENPILFFLSCFLFPLSFILAVLQPRWIQPAWYRWLEENHKAIIPILKKEVRQMGVREWERRVSTQAGLEEWVEEVRRKREDKNKLNK